MLGQYDEALLAQETRFKPRVAHMAQKSTSTTYLFCEWHLPYIVLQKHCVAKSIDIQLESEEATGEGISTYIPKASSRAYLEAV